MGRILAIDYGTKRVGLAVTDPLQISANALDTIHSKDIIHFLDNYISKELVETIVVGLPTQMNGEESESMKFIKPFVNLLKKKFSKISIVYHDERFTSVLAHKTILESGLKKKSRQDKMLVDKISATIILQSYMESLR